MIALCIRPLFYDRNIKDKNDLDDYDLRLVSFDLAPEYYVMLKRPFRVRVAGDSDDPLYLLIRDTANDGAIAIDGGGKGQKVTRDFIISNWGRQVSWVYPPATEVPTLVKGMNDPDILELQRAFRVIGYLPEPTGIFDELTFKETRRFQKDFGLVADGIAGPRTRALLYQMVKKDELH